MAVPSADETRNRWARSTASAVTIGRAVVTGAAHFVGGESGVARAETCSRSSIAAGTVEPTNDSICVDRAAEFAVGTKFSSGTATAI